MKAGSNDTHNKRRDVVACLESCINRLAVITRRLLCHLDYGYGDCEDYQ